jgi:hypothetical protein
VAADSQTTRFDCCLSAKANRGFLFLLLHLPTASS